MTVAASPAADMPDLSPAALGAVVALVVSGLTAWLNRRLGLDTATARYIASLEGLVHARDAEIVDLKAQMAELTLDNRRLQRRVDALEAK